MIIIFQIFVSVTIIFFKRLYFSNVVFANVKYENHILIVISIIFMIFFLLEIMTEYSHNDLLKSEN
jgi:hypothetical protein